MFKKSKTKGYVIKVGSKYLNEVKPVAQEQFGTFKYAAILSDFRQGAILFQFLPDAEEMLKVVESGRIYKIDKRNWDEEPVYSYRFCLVEELCYEHKEPEEKKPIKEAVSDTVEDVIEKADKKITKMAKDIKRAIKNKKDSF